MILTIEKSFFLNSCPHNAGDISYNIIIFDAWQFKCAVQEYLWQCYVVHVIDHVLPIATRLYGIAFKYSYSIRIYSDIIDKE